MAIGPRAIYQFNPISELVVDRLEILLTVVEKSEANIKARNSTAGVLMALLNKLSAIWASEKLRRVIALLIRYDRMSEIDQIGKAIVKHIPVAVCIPAIIETWETVLCSEKLVSPH